MDIVHVSEKVNGLQSAFFLMDSRGRLLCLKKTPKHSQIPLRLQKNTFLMCLGTQFVVCVCTEQTIEAILSMKVNLGVRNTSV